MITDAEVVRFSNERLRPLCDASQSAFRSAMHFVAEWDSKGLGDTIPNDATVVADGSDVDGRGAVTGADLHRVYGFWAGLIATMAANNQLDLAAINRVAVNGQPRF